MKPLLKVSPSDYARYSAEVKQARKENQMVIAVDPSLPMGVFKLTGNIKDLMGESSSSEPPMEESPCNISGVRGSKSSRKRNRDKRWS